MTPTREGPDNWLEQITEPEQAAGGRRIKTTVERAAGHCVMGQSLITSLPHGSEINDGAGVCADGAAAVDAALPMNPPVTKSPWVGFEK